MHQTLSQQLEALCAEHQLTCVAIHLHVGERRTFYSANAHADGHGCTQSIAGTPEEALSAAIGEMNMKRAPLMAVVPALAAA